MNPGMFAAGGGGGGGGGDDDAADAGKDKEGAGNENGGEDGSGDDKGACGAGSGASGCPKHGEKPSAGDPVEVLTGRVHSLPALDLFIPGPLNLEFERTYSSSATERDLGLGWGWSHTFAWTIGIERRTVHVYTAASNEVEFDRPTSEDGESVSAGGWELWRLPDGFGLDAKDELTRIFRFVASPEETVLRLSEVRDRNGNAIKLRYENGHLREIVDSVGRVVAVRTTPEGRIASLAVKNAETNGRWIEMVTYQYDADGNLLSATDADDFKTAYTYADRRMTSARMPSGYTSHYRYLADGRCFETWGDYEGKVDESLSANVPKLLADGTTAAKGVHHVRIQFSSQSYTEVADSVQVQRFFGAGGPLATKTVSAGGVTTRKFDEFGYLVAMTDAIGATTQYTRDQRGRLLSETDPLGRTRKMVRDSSGAIVEFVAPDGGVWKFERDRVGNVVALIDPNGAMTRFKYDGRGQIVEEEFADGTRRLWNRDAQGNVVERVDQNGARWRFVYNAFGRVVSLTNPLNATVRAAYTDGGRLTTIYDADGGVTRFTYDGEKRLTQVIIADGSVHKWKWAGFDCIVEYQRADQGTLKFRYNREGWLLEVYNERGEVHTYRHNALGSVLEERTFDGRTNRYKYDALMRCTLVESGRGEKLRFEYDAAGQLTTRALPNDEIEEFTYDACGRVVGMKSSVGTFALERDRCGNVLREIQDVGGTPQVIEHAYDSFGRRMRTTSSLGYTEEVQRDVMGQRAKVVLDGREVIKHETDALGAEVARVFHGSRMSLDFDIVGCLTRLSVAPSTAARPTVGPEPPRIGGAPVDPSTIDKRYRYNPVGEIVHAWDKRSGATYYEYDVRGRLRSRSVNETAVEAWRYDETDNPFEVNGKRVYQKGNVLVEKDRTRYVWDEDARLVEKRLARDDGAEDVWRYAWNSAGLLEAVTTPSGDRVEFAYDPLARRIAKRVLRPRAGEPPKLLSETRFVWNGDALLHEIRHQAAADGDPIVDERTYYFGDDDFVPIAHRDLRRETDVSSGPKWFFYVVDPNGTPEALIRADGSVACELERTAWGVSRVLPGAETTTPLRFQGQYHDDETGLAYNYHRYYDPEAGRYISADPIGIYGGTNEFSYGVNPICWVDPLGLHMATAMLGNDESDMKPVPNKSSKLPGGSDEFHSGWSGKKKDNFDPTLANKDGTKKKNIPFGKAYRESHSEQKIMKQLAAGHPNGVNPDLEGKTLEITGESRSCPNCARALEKFAKKNKMQVIYKTKGHGDLVIDARPGGTGKNNTTAYNRRSVKHYSK